MKTDLGYIRGAQGEVGPQGETGAQGPAATIEVGSVTTSAYGTPANVVNSGTENAAIFDFTIPQGQPGETVADVSELTANFITESAESYPTYTTTEKMKVILGKIKKYLADLKSEAASIASKITAAEKNITNIQTDVGGINTALTGKLDKTDVIANLTATTSGKALDATQGKALQDQITQLNSDLSQCFAPKGILYGSANEIDIGCWRVTNDDPVDGVTNGVLLCFSPFLGVFVQLLFTSTNTKIKSRVCWYNTWSKWSNLSLS